MQVHRVVVPGSRVESWTVLGEDGVPVAAVESWLAYLSNIGRSPKHQGSPQTVETSS